MNIRYPIYEGVYRILTKHNRIVIVAVKFYPPVEKEETPEKPAKPAKKGKK